MIPECARGRHLILASTLGAETERFPMSVRLRPLQEYGSVNATSVPGLGCVETAKLI